MRPAKKEFSIDYMIAQLVSDPFWLSYEQIAELTDRQIVLHYHHPRDDKGDLVAPAVEVEMPDPERELTLEEQVKLLYEAGKAFGVPEAELDKARAELEARYGQRSQPDS